MIRIDAHHHAWKLGRRPHAWLDGAEMAAIRRDFTLADLAPLTAAAGDECLADGFTEGGVPGKSRNRVHAQDGDALGSQARGALRD